MNDRYTTEALKADVAAGGYGIQMHPAQAQELLRLDTVERRQRAVAEAHTLQNLMGGIMSGNLFNAVRDLQRNIDAGHEEQELYGERTAREYREREKALREARNNPAAIYYPPTLRAIGDWSRS